MTSCKDNSIELNPEVTSDWFYSAGQTLEYSRATNAWSLEEPTKGDGLIWDFYDAQGKLVDIDHYLPDAYKTVDLSGADVVIENLRSLNLNKAKSKCHCPYIHFFSFVVVFLPVSESIVQWL